MQLKPITLDNFKEVIRLKVAEDQKGFVASNVYSLAEAYASPNCVPLAIYDGDTLVGFTMYNRCDPNEGHLWIYRLMVDHRFQRRGLGREAMRLLLKTIMAELDDSVLYPNKPTEIYISFEPENLVAKKLYLTLGFRSTQQIIDHEEVLKLSLKK